MEPEPNVTLFSGDGSSLEDKSDSLFEFEFFGKGKTLKDIDPWNITTSLEEIPLDSNFAWLLFLLLVSVIWLTYCIYYNSRLFAFVSTILVNTFIIPRYYGNGSGFGKKGPHCYFRVGSLSISFISGKIMVRDFAFITPDYSLRIQDGFLIFRWWLPYQPKDVRKTDLSHSDTRLSFVLNGYELHIYNRCQTYNRLEKLFNIPQRLFPDKEDGEPTETDQLHNSSSNGSSKPTSNDELITSYLWRDFIPVTKFDIFSGRFVFGNPMLPSVLSVRFEEAHITYTSRPALSPHDLFTHIMKAKAESFKVVLIPSPKYLGLSDEPPRYMGEGFVVIQSNNVDFYYYQDEPGFVCEEPENIELPTGDIIQRFTSPAWGLDATEVTPKSEFGELRQFETFDFRLNTLNDASIDLLFVKNKETNALHINAGPGSYLEVTVPYVTKEAGYESHIVFQILHLDATTSLSYRSFAQSETLEVDIKIKYPKTWNDHQEWLCTLTGCKASVSLVFAHKWFMTDLIDDWASKGKPDILGFVPYTWKFTILLKEFELLILANEHNWIDCSSNVINENIQLAVCGDTFDMSFDLPFDEFLPKTVPIKMWIQGENLDASIYYPEANPHRDIIELLYNNAKLSPLRPSNEKITLSPSEIFGKRWRLVSTKENGWTTCWSVPIVAISVCFTYHPSPPIDFWLKESDLPTPDREELLLDTLRPDAVSSIAAKRSRPPEGFDPGTLDPDLVEVDIEIGPSTLCLYGVILRMLWDIKENYVGECQQFTDFTASPDLSKTEKEGTVMASFSRVTFADQSSPILKPFDGRLYRPLAVNLSLAMHDIHAHLMKSCKKDEAPCPYIYLERLAFEMDKGFYETKLQVLLSPLFVNVTDSIKRIPVHNHLADGFLVLDALQFRGHAMFSGVGRPLDSETLEYSWLMEVSLGELSGRVTLPQMLSLAEALETIIFQVSQEDASLQPPNPYRKCLHDKLQSVCPDSDSNMNKLCPNSEDLKYRMVRLSVASIDVSLVESSSMLNLRLVPLKMATCNLHSCHSSSGVTLLIDHIAIRQLVLQNPRLDSSLIGSKLKLTEITEQSWLEVFVMTTGPIFLDAATNVSAIDTYSTSQNSFLIMHDEQTKRLWFLWKEKSLIELHEEQSKTQKCGCIGGCAFFGKNRAGATFFESVKSNRKQRVDVSDDYQPGESLLNRGEPVLGFPLRAVLSCFGDDELDSIEISANTGHEPLSPFVGRESPSSPFPLHIASTSHSKGEKRFLFNRQLSSPSRGSPFSKINRSRSNLSTTFSPSGKLHSSGSSNIKIPSKERVNVHDDLLLQRARSASEGGATEQDVQSQILSCLLNDPENLEDEHSLAMRTKSLESQGTLLDQYVSADEGDTISSGSETLKQYVSANTHMQATSTNKTQSILSDDTFKSLTSLTTDKHVSSDPAMASSMSHLGVSQSYASLRSTFSAPPASNDVTLEPLDDASIASTSSFMSATSSHHEANVDEGPPITSDTLVDLHGQMVKPVIESPILMQVYNTHLTKRPSGEWNTARPPFPCGIVSGNRLSENCSNRRVRWTPRFPKKADEGFSALKVVSKKSMAELTIDTKMPLRRDKSEQYSPGRVYEEIKEEDDEVDEPSSGKEKGENEDDDFVVIEILDEGQRKRISEDRFEYKSERVTVLVKVSGETDIKLTPLSLDALSTLVESLNSTFSSVCPLSLLNHLAIANVLDITNRNILKKERTLQLGQLKVNAWRSTLEREKSLQKMASTTMMFRELASGAEGHQLHDDKYDLIVNQYKETRKVKTQVFIRFAKVNLAVLQASLIDELITFAELDNMKDLTCVSILAASASSLNINLRSDFKETRWLKTYIDSNPRTVNIPSAFANFPQRDLVARLFSRKPKKKTAEVEPITVETQEIEVDSAITVVNVDSLHAQLNRMKTSNNSNESGPIPFDQSKVSFKLESTDPMPKSPRYMRQPSSTGRGILKRQEAAKDWNDVFIEVRPDTSATMVPEDDTEPEIPYIDLSSGIIVFECGLEAITIDAVSQKVSSLTNADLGDEDAERAEVKADDKETNKKRPMSFNGDLGNLWLNFGSPPKMANSKRFDCNLLDWHLLSTVLPLVNAWTSSVDRSMIVFLSCSKSASHRLDSVIGTLIQRALEIDTPSQLLERIASLSDGSHLATTKYLSRKRTPLAKSLQENPSSQIIYALRKHLKQKHWEDFDGLLTAEEYEVAKEFRKVLIAFSGIPEKIIIEDEPVQVSSKAQRPTSEPVVSDQSDVVIEMYDLSSHAVDADKDLPTPLLSQPPTMSQTNSAVLKKPNTSSDQLKKYAQALLNPKPSPDILFGIVKVHKVDMVAMLSGLKLEGQMKSFQLSFNHKTDSFSCTRESSITGKIAESTLSLIEESQSNQQLVVKMTIGKTQTLLSSHLEDGKDGNSALLNIGPIYVDIPQHPVALHDMVTRSSRQFSTTLHEFRTSRQPSRTSRHNEESQYDPSTSFVTAPISRDQVDALRFRSHGKHGSQMKPLAIQFNVIVDTFTVGAALLPSLRAQYRIGEVTSSGSTGSEAKFIVDVTEHSLSFNTQVVSIEANLPSSASVALPPIHVAVEYIDDSSEQAVDGVNLKQFGSEGVVLRKGSYFNATADIESFEHSLTTDLLNHLLLVQKVFMKEVNEVVQKMSGIDTKDSSEQSKEVASSSRAQSGKFVLFSLHLRLKGIEITATTPTSSAVRFETGALDLQLSNRVQNISRTERGEQVNLKTFVKLQVNVSVALGQLIKNTIFEEAEPDFQQLAYFKTRIITRNALQDELVSSNSKQSSSEDKEAVLFTLNRPLMYIQPLALDKAVLVWLNYKNAYEYWNEQRANLNKEVLTATQQVLNKVQQPIANLSSQALGTLFVQLTVDDLGICLPVGSAPTVGASSTLGSKLNYDSELKSALVITLVSTKISACSCGSLVSKAKFTGLCFRFVDDFETSLDDWKPDPNDTSVMNLCQVSEGTYEICSKTITATQGGGSDAKWFLNVQWKMEGFDIHVDTSIGKQLSGLFRTLTALAGDEDELGTGDYSSVISQGMAEENGGDGSTPLAAQSHLESPLEANFDAENGVQLRRSNTKLNESTLDAKKRSRLIEKELNEQVKIIHDLRQLGASQSTIDQEVKRLRELESVVFNDFRRDVIKRLRRQSIKNTNGSGKPPFSRVNSLASPTEGERLKRSQLKTVPSVEMDSGDVIKPLSGAKPTKLEPLKSPVVQPGNLSSGSGSEKSLLQMLTRSPDSSPGDESSQSHELSTGSSLSTQMSESVLPQIVTSSPRDSVHDNVSKQSSTTSSILALSTKQSSHQLQEPNIDFELDIMIFFNSGKCVLHTRDPKSSDEETSSAKKAMARDRSFTGTLDSATGPSPKTTHPRYQARSSSASIGRSFASGHNFRGNASASKLRGQAGPADFTLFLIPGLDIKVHYNSKMVNFDSPQGQGSSFGPSHSKHGLSKDLEFQTSMGAIQRKFGTKKASCYAWMTLHSIPEETIITPHLLDFLEQALEPIPIEIQQMSHGSAKTSTPTEDTSNGGQTDDMLTSAPAQYAVYGSFPVDVIVYLHVQPSVLRFSCLPVSRVECLLQLPSVDLVFSSKRNRDELLDNFESGSTSVPLGTSPKPPPSSKLKPPRHRRAASDHFRQPMSSTQPVESSIGGLSVSGRLADFSLYIFHPYGGGKKTSLVTQQSGESASSSPLRGYSDRKDSLSLQVEFVKVNISRSRKLLYTQETVQSRLGQAVPERHRHTAMVKFSALCDIGSASFKYDMRRLTEILAFPRAWYRKAIWKRMFLGDQSVRGTIFSDSDEEENVGQNETESTSSSNGSLNDYKANSNKNQQFKRQETVNRESLWLNLTDVGQKGAKNIDWRCQASTAKAQPLPWETLLLFGVNLSKLSVQMNMGNVMGNTSWLTRGFRSEGKVSIDSTGHKCLSVGVGCDGSSLDAKGGIVGGTIELTSIDTRLTVQEERGREPDHVVKLNLHSFEKKLDYMGTSVLMLRVSELDLTLRDEWRVDHLHGSRAGSDHPTKRPALIFIHSQLRWDQLQVLMSKSTTPDILKMIYKLEEFFTQQFHSSKRVLSSLQPSKSFNRSSSFKSKSRKQAGHGLPHPDSMPMCADVRHHRHWQRALRLVSGLPLSTLSQPLPSYGTIIGGTVELSGKKHFPCLLLWHQLPVKVLGTV
ncbi:putative transmembrane protein [Halotydeus destructor]|nr:putative transmembrane protein [Halotydeus destructor]